MLASTQSPVPVVITGFGVVCPLGCSVEEITNKFLAGTEITSQDGGSAVAEIPTHLFSDPTRARIGRVDRLTRMYLSASHLALHATGLVLADVDAERVGLSFGTGLGCLLTDEEFNRKIVEQGPAAASPRLFAYTVSSAAAGEVSIALGIKGPNVTSHMGFAAGLGALGYGYDLIQTGRADIVLAGGADVIGAPLMQGLRDMGLLKGPDRSRPFTDATPGIWPAEAAVVAVLERADHARARRARCWGEVRGYAAGFEPTLPRADATRAGVAATLQRALQQSGVSPQEVTLIVVSAHGTPVDRIERDVLAEIFADKLPPLLAHKERIGDSFAASGPLGLALACGCLQRGAYESRRPDIVMVNTLCYSGNVVSVLFDRHVL